MKDCQGTVFKAAVSHYRSARGFGLKVRMTVAKEHSCPGCLACYWQSASFDEVGNDWPILGIETAQDGRFYRIDTCNVTRDCETGITDGCDLCLVEYLPPLADSEATDLATLMELA